MIAQDMQSPYMRILCKLIDTNWTLTRLLTQEIEGLGGPARLRPHGPPVPDACGTAPPGEHAASDNDVPIEPTSPAMHVGEGQVREPEHIVPSFDALPPGKLGAEIVRMAQIELARPVKEKYVNSTPINVDEGGHIKKYFVEGPRWKEETWDSYTENHGGVGPAWCAAFASFCWRSAHRALGVELPLKLNAQCSVLWEQAHSLARFIPPGRTPAPGDMVFLGSGSSPGHVGLVEKTDPDGIIYFIEGNAGANTDQLCRSRLIPGKPRYAKLMGFLAAEEPPHKD